MFKKSIADIVETIVFFNLLALTPAVRLVPAAID